MTKAEKCKDKPVLGKPKHLHGTVSVLKFEHCLSIHFWTKVCFYVAILKILSEMANSVDPDQTAP